MTQATRLLPADRLAELDALAALYAERWGDTPQITDARQHTLRAEVAAYEDRAWQRAMTPPAPAGPLDCTSSDRSGAATDHEPQPQAIYQPVHTKTDRTRT